MASSRARLPAAPACCLAAGGFDPSGGAGVLADVAAILAAGVRPVAAVTTVTVQTHAAFRGARPVPARLFARQLDALLETYPVGAIKTGALPTAEHVAVLARRVDRLAVPLVVDPVLGASRGRGLVGATVRAALLRRLVPLATLLTPNAAEAAALAGVRVRSRADAERAAARLGARGAGAVLVKGGHLPGGEDVLWTPGGTRVLRGGRIRGVELHGAGCTLASATAAALALGVPLVEAVRFARVLVRESLRAALRRRPAWGPDCLSAWAEAAAGAARG